MNIHIILVETDQDHSSHSIFQSMQHVKIFLTSLAPKSLYVLLFIRKWQDFEHTILWGHTYGRFECSSSRPYNIIKPSLPVRFVGTYGLWMNLLCFTICYFDFATRLQFVWGWYVVTNNIILKHDLKKLLEKREPLSLMTALGVANIEKTILS